MATIDILLNNLDEVIEGGMNLPLSRGRCIIDADSVREIIDDIRLQLPNEIKQAKAVVSDRNEILGAARREAESLIRKAEDRAKSLIESDTIVSQANSKALAMLNEASQKANEIMALVSNKVNELNTHSTSKATEILSQANMRSREMKQAAYEFSETSLRNTEESLSRALAEVRTTRQALQATAPESNRPQLSMPNMNVMQHMHSTPTHQLPNNNNNNNNPNHMNHPNNGKMGNNNNGHGGHSNYPTAKTTMFE